LEKRICGEKELKLLERLDELCGQIIRDPSNPYLYDRAYVFVKNYDGISYDLKEHLKTKYVCLEGLIRMHGAAQLNLLRGEYAERQQRIAEIKAQIVQHEDEFVKAVSDSLFGCSSEHVSTTLNRYLAEGLPEIELRSSLSNEVGLQHDIQIGENRTHFIICADSHDVRASKDRLLARVRKHMTQRLQEYSDRVVNKIVQSNTGPESLYARALEEARLDDSVTSLVVRLKKAHQTIDGAKNALRTEISRSLGKPMADVYKRALIQILGVEKGVELELANSDDNYAGSEEHHSRMRSINRQLHFLTLSNNHNSHYTGIVGGAPIEPNQQIPGVNCNLQEFREALVAAGMYEGQADRVKETLQSLIDSFSPLRPRDIIEAISKPTYFWGSNVKIAESLFVSGVITKPLRDAIVITSAQKNRNIEEVVGDHNSSELFEPGVHPGFGNASVVQQPGGLPKAVFAAAPVLDPNIVAPVA
jgi:hypothetical protein